MNPDLAIVGRLAKRRGSLRLSTLAALGRAGFRRFATYRQATIAATFTNTIFGFLRCYVLLAAVATAPGGLAGGYDAQQLALYTWASQGLIGVVMLWGWTDLSDRIRTGDVAVDLMRPIHPVLSYLAVDLGRAAYSMMTRFVVPIVVGALIFDLYLPRRASTYAMFAISVALGVVVSFGCRYLINAVGFWFLDIRGFTLLWMIGTSALGGLAFPLHFLPAPVVATLWVATPFPSILQAPLDIAVERGGAGHSALLLLGQAGWAALALGASWWIQSRAERKVVIQGG